MAISEKEALVPAKNLAGLSGPLSDQWAIPFSGMRTKIFPNIVIWNDGFPTRVVDRLEELWMQIDRLHLLLGILLQQERMEEKERPITYITIRLFLPDRSIPSLFPIPKDWQHHRGRLSDLERVLLEATVALPTQAASPDYFQDDRGKKLVLAYGNLYAVEEALDLRHLQPLVHRVNAEEEDLTIRALKRVEQGIVSERSESDTEIDGTQAIERFKNTLDLRYSGEQFLQKRQMKTGHMEPNSSDASSVHNTIQPEEETEALCREPLQEEPHHR